MTAADAAAPARCSAPPLHGLAIRVQPGRETVAVVPAGELDLPGSRRLGSAIDELVESGFEDIVIDLRDLEFIDCAGVRVLLTQHAAAVRDGRRLSLIHGRAGIRRVFALTGTLDMLPFDRPRA
ncbi:MAG: STAS domain-containing protein [Solirubrobacteraceae bacterium]|nr:STAS domain-containing protein [Solirubrobacteraceae bacterium]